MASKYAPRYKELRLPTMADFNKWLIETATKNIYFKDNGQDLINIQVDDRGEILYANLQQGVWHGKFIDMTKVEVGKPIRMRLSDKWHTMDFIIEEIIPVK